MDDDIPDIMEVAEGKKILKLKGSRDDMLQLNLQQIELQIAKLQQDMIELQISNVNLSATNQNENEIKKKLDNNCKICNLLIDKYEEMKNKFAECKLDQDILSVLFQRASQIVQDFKLGQTQINEKNKLTIEALKEKVKSITDHQSQIVQIFTETKQKMDTELSATKAELATIHSQRNELSTAVFDMNTKLEEHKLEIEKKGEAISALEGGSQLHKQDYTVLNNKVEKLEHQLKEVTASKAPLQEAIVNLLAYPKMLCDQKDLTLKKLEMDHNTALGTISELKVKLENKEIDLTESTKRILEMETEKTRLTEEIRTKQNTIDSLQIELNKRIVNSGDNCVPAKPDNNPVVFLLPLQEHDGKSAVSPLTAAHNAVHETLRTMITGRESSEDGNILDPVEVNRSSNALAGGQGEPSVDISTSKKRRLDKLTVQDPSLKTTKPEPAQNKYEPKLRQRRIFKTRGPFYY